LWLNFSFYYFRAFNFRRHSCGEVPADTFRGGRSQSAHNIGELESSNRTRENIGQRPLLILTKSESAQIRKDTPDVILPLRENENGICSLVEETPHSMTENDSGRRKRQPSSIKLLINRFSSQRFKRRSDYSRTRHSDDAASRHSFPVSNSNSDLRSRENRWIKKNSKEI